MLTGINLEIPPIKYLEGLILGVWNNLFAFQELYRKVRSILNKLTPQKFQTLTQQIIDLDIDTAERLEGAIDLIFEKVGLLYRSKWDWRWKVFILVWFTPYITDVFFLWFHPHVTFSLDLLQAIDEAAFSVAYANMCRCLIPVSDICFKR